MSRYLLLLILVAWFAAESSPPVPIDLGPISRQILIFGVFGLIVLIPALWSRTLARHVITRDIRRSLNRYNWGVTIARAMIPIWFAVCVFALGWVDIVHKALGAVGRWPVALPGTFCGTLPPLLAWSALWWATYPADRALREQSFERQLNEDLPVHMPPSFWTYFASNMRMQILFTLVPVAAILLVRDVCALLMSWSLGVHFDAAHNIVRQVGSSATAANIATIAEWVILPLSSIGVFVFVPEVLRHVLKTERLPDSPLRQRLEEICRRSNLRYRDILFWHTGNNMGNALVMGLVPRVRYILLSDTLLQTMNDRQIEAVFAHEAGHVVHRHIAWYVVFVVVAMAGMLMLGNAVEMMHIQFKFVPGPLRDPLLLAVTVFAFWVMFNLLSRCFERQADVFAARTMQAELAGGPSSHVGQDGASIFVSALHRVAQVNNIPIRARNFSHGSIAHRMRYLRELANDPANTARFDRFMSIIYGLLGVALVVSLAWFGLMMWKG